MSTTLKLFERWKSEKQHSSDRQALLALGVSHGAAVHWKAGRNADADIIERMAKDLGENPAAWAALAMSEQAKGEAARAWKRMARQLGAAASVAVVALFAHPVTANDATLMDAPSRHYAKSRWRSLLARGFFLARQFLASLRLRGHVEPTALLAT